MSTSTRITFYKNEILGQGSYGTVFKGEFSNENDEKKTVAVKRVLMRMEDKDFMDNLLREEEILFKLQNHRYIVQLYWVEVQQEEFR
jgi:serine/threonine protein kinase